MENNTYFTYPYIKRYLLIFLTLLVIIMLYASWEPPLGISWREMQLKTGDFSWYLLTATVAIGLLRKLLPKNQVVIRLLPLRKYTGLFAFLFAVIHLLASWLRVWELGMLLPDFLTRALEPTNAMLFGWIALFAFVPAFLTSTHYAFRTLKHNHWKFLQRFTHLAFIFAGLHIALISYLKRDEIDWVTLSILIFYLCAYLYLYAKQTHKTKILNSTIVFLLVMGAVGSISATSALAQGTSDGTGVDAILELLGQEKPEQWNTWSRSQKFSYLQNMGVYPDGRKYRGSVTDLSGYFTWLDKPQPENWLSMSYEERNTYVTGENNLNTLLVNTFGKTVSKNTLYYFALVAGMLFGILVMWIARKTDNLLK